ncbi:Kinesin-like protein KIF13B [Geodia barretti]|uniref:Kinesin-like protein KIF13B n=1 Tax=Geodia barretti TaxID=519541 RepID=A0AA35R108_GEOBA|nr:Kinesin-like protein KIF13B [Geodia barretti]
MQRHVTRKRIEEGGSLVICGKLKLSVKRVPTLLDREMDGEEVDAYSSWSMMQSQPSMMDDLMDIRHGQPLSCQVTVIESSGLPKEYCHYVFCQYQFWGQEEPMIIPPLQGSINSDQKIVDKVQFSHSQTFTVEITEDFLSHVEEGVLGVEVWGHRRSGFMDLPMPPGDPENEGKRQKSFPEKWSELTQRLELWVEIMELNDQGEYIPVEQQSKADVMTGGVFMIRQGQSRRINVAVQPVVGGPGADSNLMRAQSISSIAIGSCYLRNRYDEHWTPTRSRTWRGSPDLSLSLSLPPSLPFSPKLQDLFPPLCLKLMRTRWNEAVMNRRDYLDTEVRKLMEKKEPSVTDLEKQNELLDQNLSQGMEMRVPVLFLDMSVLEDDESALPCPPTTLFGEKPESMIDIPIIKKEENDPPNVAITLNKRVCLCVYKKIGFGASLLRAFKTRDVRTACGVMYECVLGIPKSEGMQAPPKIPANPSFVELDEDENAVETFKTAMASIASILTLDKLKQEVALKEKLASIGRTLRKRYSVQQRAAVPRVSSSGGMYGGSESTTPEPEDLHTSPLPGEGLRMPPLNEEEATTVGGGGRRGRESELGPEAMVLDEESGETSQLIPIPEEGGVEPGQDDDSEQVHNNRNRNMFRMEWNWDSRAVEVEETRTAGVNDLPTASTATGPGVEIGTTEGQGQTPAETEGQGQTPAETETENEPAAEGEGEEKGVEPAAVLMDILEVPEIQIRVEVEEEEGGRGGEDR